MKNDNRDYSKMDELTKSIGIRKGNSDGVYECPFGKVVLDMTALAMTPNALAFALYRAGKKKGRSEVQREIKTALGMTQ